MKSWQKFAIVIAFAGVFIGGSMYGPQALQVWHGLFTGQIDGTLHPLYNEEVVEVKFLVRDALNGSLLSGATVRYRPLGGVGSSVGLTGANGFTTPDTFLETSTVVYLVEFSGYYTVSGQFTIPAADYSQNNVYTAPAIQIYDIGGSLSLTITDQDGSAVTTAYNSTASGTDLTLNILFTVGEDDSAFGNSYMNWHTGISYSGPFLVISLDSNLYVVETQADDIVYDGTSYHYIFYFTRVINEAREATDGRASFSINIDLQDDGADALDVQVFGEVRTDRIGNANFGSADASVLAIDIES